MKKIILYNIILLLFSSCASSKYKSGIITYDINMDEAAKRQGMERNVGTQATVKFNKKYLHLKRNKNTPSNEFEIVDLKTGQLTQYVSVFNQNFAIKMEGESLPDLSELTMTEETKEIAGLPCKKATWTMNGQEAHVYLTDAIKPYFCPFTNQEYGFALEYQLNYPYGKFTYTAKEANFQKIDKRLLLPPEDYKNVTPLEYQKAIFNRKVKSFIGRDAPNFSLKSLDGKVVELQETKGKYILINFWFTTCPPCIKEIPDLNRLKRQYRNKNIEFWAITFSEEQKVRDFLVEHPFAFDVFADAKDITKIYEIASYPSTILIDPNGKIVAEQIGGKMKIFDKLETMIETHVK